MKWLNNRQMQGWKREAEAVDDTNTKTKWDLSKQKRPTMYKCARTHSREVEKESQLLELGINGYTYYRL